MDRAHDLAHLKCRESRPVHDFLQAASSEVETSNPTSPFPRANEATLAVDTATSPANKESMAFRDRVFEGRARYAPVRELRSRSRGHRRMDHAGRR